MSLDPRASDDTLTIFERSRAGPARVHARPQTDVPEVPVEELLPASQIRERPAELPEVSEPEIVRHYIDALVEELPPRRGLLPARLVHDEAQPQAARARGGAARATRACTRCRTPSTPRARSS